MTGVGAGPTRRTSSVFHTQLRSSASPPSVMTTVPDRPITTVAPAAGAVRRHAGLGDVQGDPLAGVVRQGPQQPGTGQRHPGGDVREGGERLPVVGVLPRQQPAVPAVPVRRTEPDPVRGRLQSHPRGAADRGGHGPQLVAVGRAGPCRVRGAGRGQGAGGEPVAVGGGQRDRAGGRLDPHPGEHLP
jgi:hypothetical protein